MQAKRVALILVCCGWLGAALMAHAVAASSTPRLRAGLPAKAAAAHWLDLMFSRVEKCNLSSKSHPRNALISSLAPSHCLLAFALVSHVSQPSLSILYL